MKKSLITVIAMVVAASSLLADDGSAAKPQVSIVTDLELFYEISDDIGGIKGDNDKFKSNQLYVDILGKFEKDLSARLKLDGADIVSSDGKVVSEKIVEEANFTMSKIGGYDVSATFGKDEMPFGLDHDKYLNDSIVHMFEIDKVWGANATVGIPKIGSLSAGAYQHNHKIAAGDTVISADNELRDNYSGRLVIDDVVDGILVSFSGSRENYSDLLSVDEMDAEITIIKKREERWGAAVAFNCPKGMGNINAEYVSFKNIKGMPGQDPSITTLGIEFNACENVTVWGRLEMMDSDVIGPKEEDFWSAGVKYKATDNFFLLAEYSNFNSSDLSDAAADLLVANDSIEDSLLLGVKAKY